VNSQSTFTVKNRATQVDTTGQVIRIGALALFLNAAEVHG
jgi:hypothetical protein